jgi:peptidoglycan/LPS O-acetylase OafA/YrhL
LPHLPALDGLRGLALVGVLLFHAGGALRGGYLGVDLFFVLSGFLITRLLLHEREETGAIALGAFWVRRARRLFPALLSLMPAVAVYGRFFARPDELAPLRGDALATLAYVANWREILSDKSYWELFAAPSLLEHTWSLSIEEQFYVVWPLVVMVLLRRGRPRAVLAAALSAFALSALAMVVRFDPGNVSRVYLGTDTRAAGLAAGAALATVLAPDAALPVSAVRALDGLGLVTAAGLAVAWWTLDGQDPWLYHGGLWLTEAGALILIACAAAGPASLVARALSWRPLTLLGTISYGAYLWHWPVDVFLSESRLHISGIGLHATQLAVTFAIAIASYRLLERPIRTGPLPFGRLAYAAPAAAVVAVLLVVRGTHARPLPPAPPPPPLAEAAPPPIVDVPTFPILVVGDSTANSLGWVLRGLREPGVGVELFGRDGCTMLADSCGGDAWSAEARTVHPATTLAFFGGAFLHGVSDNGAWRKACRPAWDAPFERNLSQRLRGLVPDGGRVWAVTVPYPLGPYESAAFRAEVDCINASVRKAAASVPGVRILDLAERLCPLGRCEREAGGVMVRPDGVHYDMEGASGLARWVLGEIRDGARVPSADQNHDSQSPASISAR